MLPEDLAGRVKGLENYEFVSPEAAALFETLSERLREQLMSNYVNQLTDAVQGMSGAQMDRMKDMMAELNDDARSNVSGAKRRTSRASWSALATCSQANLRPLTNCSR
ncbi:MAG: hypothetical protein V9F03_01695 [Microthrixaceae bacterium]